MNETGELPANAPSYADLRTLVNRYKRLLDGQQLRIADMERQLEEHEDTHAGAADIREILGECKKLNPRIRIIPNSVGWMKVKARLNEFELVELKAVPHGARKDPFYCAQSHRLLPAYIYREADATARLVDLGMGVVEQTLPNGFALPRALGEKLINLNPYEWEAIDRCECGHLQFQHLHYGADGPMYGWHWCSKCDCTDYSREYASVKAVRDEEPPQTGQLGLEAA